MAHRSRWPSAGCSRRDVSRGSARPEGTADPACHPTPLRGRKPPRWKARPTPAAGASIPATGRRSRRRLPSGTRRCAKDDAGSGGARARERGCSGRLPTTVRAVAGDRRRSTRGPAAGSVGAGAGVAVTGPASPPFRKSCSGRGRAGGGSSNRSRRWCALRAPSRRTGPRHGRTANEGLDRRENTRRNLCTIRSGRACRATVGRPPQTRHAIHCFHCIVFLSSGFARPNRPRPASTIGLSPQTYPQDRPHPGAPRPFAGQARPCRREARPSADASGRRGQSLQARRRHP